MLQVPNATAQVMAGSLLGLASSASREESEETYSGMSSVPMISSGSKSRLKEER
jgi:hypothetical protein